MLRAGGDCTHIQDNVLELALASRTGRTPISLMSWFGEEHVPLASYSTFHLGGPARFFVRAKKVEDIRTALAFAHDNSLPTLIIGSGSNLLITEKGFEGVVIKMELRGVTQEENEERVVYIVSSGERWDSVVARACQRGLWGLENLSGIPGTVGAAPIQNIGAYGLELQEVLLWVEALDTISGELVRYTTTECELGYRSSIFKKNLDRYVILRVALALSRLPRPRLGYRDLAEAFLGASSPTPEEIRTVVLGIRDRKFPDLSKEGTAGSFFLNPIVPEDYARALLSRFPALPHFTVPSGVKLSLAWLLDHALHCHGMHSGGARLYENQPLVIVTNKEATSRDVLVLKDKVIALVFTTLQLSIDIEVRIV